MPAGSNVAKILAKIIKMYRAAYVTTAQASTEGTNISQVIIKAILGGKAIQPSVNPFVGKKVEDIIKILGGGFQK